MKSDFHGVMVAYMEIKSYNDYRALILKIIQQGHDLMWTYELTGESLHFKNLCLEDLFDKFGIDHDEAVDFIVSISNFVSKQIGPYDTSKYFNVISGTNAACDQFTIDSIDTRRAVVTFPPEHCFQSIQFLVRGGKIIIVCNMRSCDAIKNLLFDAYICMGLSNLVSKRVFGHINLGPTDLYMHFGSLHVFKEDSNVL